MSKDQVVDLETGLPQLPSGYIWRVRSIGGSFGAPYYYVVVEIVLQFTIQRRIPREILGMIFGYHKERITTTEETVVASQPVWDPLLEFNPRNDDITFDPNKKISVSTVHVGGKSFHFASPSTVTAPMIFEAAKKAVSDYHKKQEAEKLFGDYPPNKLETMENK